MSYCQLQYSSGTWYSEPTNTYYHRVVHDLNRMLYEYFIIIIIIIIIIYGGNKDLEASNSFAIHDVLRNPLLTK